MKRIHCGIIVVVVWLMTLGTLAAYDFEYDAGNIEGSKTSTGITYTLSVSKGNLGTSYDFDTRAGVTSGSPSGIDIDVTQNGATGTVIYANNSLPSSNFTISMNGKLIPPSGGSGGRQPTWCASGEAKAPFHIKSNQNDGAKEIVVPAGTSVTYTAYEGTSSKASNWTVNGQTKNNESSIIFNRSWWDVPGWFSASMGTPDPGIYNISAVPTDRPGVSDSGSMTVLTTYFSRGNSPGYDDFTDWKKADFFSNKATDYNSSPKRGQSGVVYVAVKKETFSSTVNLSLIPSNIPSDVKITKSGDSVSIDQTTTHKSTQIKLKSISEGESLIKTKLNSYTFPRHAVVCSFKRKDVKVGLVVVSVPCGNNLINPNPDCMPSEDFSPFTVCSTNVTIPSIEYRGTLTLNPSGNMPEIVNGEVLWDRGFSTNSFEQLNKPNTMPSNLDVIVYVGPGKYKSNPSVMAFTSYGLDGKCDGIVFFSGSQYATRPYVLAHEVGHYLLGEFADVSPIDDPENLMTSGGSGTDTHAAGNTKELRYEQWKLINPY